MKIRFNSKSYSRDSKSISVGKIGLLTDGINHVDESAKKDKAFAYLINKGFIEILEEVQPQVKPKRSKSQAKSAVKTEIE